MNGYAGMRFDVVIRGGSIIDGTGAPAHAADLGIAGDRIAAIGDLSQARAEWSIDARGKAVAPGFIDAHTHDDRALLSGDMANKVSQGVTTVIAGNCGISLAPFLAHERPIPPLDLLSDGAWYKFGTFGAFLDALDATPPAINGMFLVGHQTLRVGCMDGLERAASAAEITIMRDKVTDAMQAGAIGLSTGLFYPPARHAPTDEVVALAEMVRPFGGIYATHMRNEGTHLLESVDESAEIGRRAGIEVVLSHHKASGLPNHGKVKQSLAKVAEAAKTQGISLDVYPYAASSTVLLLARLEDAAKVLITWSEAIPEAQGRDLEELAAEHGVDKYEMAKRLLPAGAIYFAMSEDDVQTVLRYPEAMVGSDGLPHDPHPHPRLWGTFPRVLGHYSRDLGLMPLEEAVRRMTGLTAEKFHLDGRGVLAAGNIADVVVFDPRTIIDRADFAHPTRPAAGIDLVMVAGKPVWQDGQHTGTRAGRALRMRDGRVA
jgi:N-acyl-D-amino-acid deacylase